MSLNIPPVTPFLTGSILTTQHQGLWTRGYLIRRKRSNGSNINSSFVDCKQLSSETESYYPWRPTDSIVVWVRWRGNEAIIFSFVIEKIEGRVGFHRCTVLGVVTLSLVRRFYKVLPKSLLFTPTMVGGTEKTEIYVHSSLFLLEDHKSRDTQTILWWISVWPGYIISVRHHIREMFIIVLILINPRYLLNSMVNRLRIVWWLFNIR